ncbi:MAG: single-stranded-DNA-specific exonuclease RecJ, partial [Roseburia sp.]|nr:single-stranded-DNA-specific exonuclease RecJ [Roseburia sp.]
VELNTQRKDMTAEGVEEAKLVVEKGGAGEKVLVIFLSEIHESLAGIIAGRIREQYHKPTFVLTRSEEGVKGSGRSVEEYSMYEELCKCQELFTKFGGHPMAAGISLQEKNVDLFREKINGNCTLQEEDFIPKVKIDIAMPLDYPDAALVREMDLLEPFGKGNVKPQFADRNLQVERAVVVGRNMNVLKLNLLTEHGNRVPAVYFGDIDAWKAYYAEKFGQQALEAAFRGQKNEIRMSVVYYPEVNTYQGSESVQAIIRSYK